jgi:small subunit ribosomal protein S2
MEKYIIKKKNKIHIINLKETVKALVQARHFLKKMALQGKTVLFVGTRRQAASVIKKEAERSNMPYINYRWVGGFLTNRDIIIERIDKYYELLDLEKTVEFQSFSKKQVARHNREKEKILKTLSGVMDMNGMPHVLIVVGMFYEEIAIAEATKLSIPVIAIGDTDSDPGIVDCCIPANDESFRSIALILEKLTDGIIEGREQMEGKGKQAVSFGPDKEEKAEEEPVEEKKPEKKKAEKKKTEKKEAEKKKTEKKEAEKKEKE